MKKYLVMSKLTKRNLMYMAISVAVNLLLAAIAIFAFGVRYSTDDDVSMSYIAYGIYMDPSARIVFSNVVIGWLMKILFAVKSTINWQIPLYYAGLCASGYISLYEVMKTRKPKLYMLWMVFVITFFFCSYVSITFTVVSAYVCCLGYLAFFLSIQEKNRICMILSGLVIVYASLIRFESVMAMSMSVTVSWAVIVVSFILKEGKIELKEIAKKYIQPFVIVVVAMGLFYIGDKIAYMPEEWASYYEYNLLRGEVLDDCSVVNMNDEKRQRELGISKPMADTLNAWYFNDPEVFDKDLFGEIDRVSTELRGEYVKSPIRDTFFSVGRIIKDKTMIKVSIVILCLLILNASLQRNKKKWIKIICLILSIVPFLVQIFAYCFMGRYSDVVAKELPVRIVEITIMGFCMSFIIIEACFEETAELASYNKKMSLILLCIGLMFPVIAQVKEHYDIMGFSLKSESMIEEQYSFLNDGHIYVGEFRALQMFMNEYRVWQNPPRGYLYNFIPLGGCEINYPYLVEKQKNLGANNPYKSLYTNDNVYLLTVDYPELELNYLRDMYDTSIECEQVAEYSGLKVYNFINH